jgi:ABC-type protease/lipase transport system fused ATPase/permease subunit
MPHESEDEKQRIDRELIELLNELRVVLPGVQVLFAFLLILPFSKGFPGVTHAERLVYIAAVLLTTFSTVLLLAPSSYHRLRFRDPDKEQLIKDSNRLTIAGTAALALAILCVVYLVTAYVFSSWAGLAAVAFCGIMFVVFWYALPMSQQLATRRDAVARGASAPISR